MRAQRWGVRQVGSNGPGLLLSMLTINRSILGAAVFSQIVPPMINAVGVKQTLK